METKLYLAYSSDIHPTWMEEHLGHNGKYVGKTLLADYLLCFRGSPGSAKATLEDAAGSVVPCVLWRINAEAVRILAAELDDYDMVELPVSYCGFSTTALSFILRPGKPLNAPAADTVATMKAGYKIQDIPERLLDQAVQMSSV